MFSAKGTAPYCRWLLLAVGKKVRGLALFFFSLALKNAFFLRKPTIFQRK